MPIFLYEAYLTKYPSYKNWCREFSITVWGNYWLRTGFGDSGLQILARALITSLFDLVQPNKFLWTITPRPFQSSGLSFCQLRTLSRANMTSQDEKQKYEFWLWTRRLTLLGLLWEAFIFLKIWASSPLLLALRASNKLDQFFLSDFEKQDVEVSFQKLWPSLLVKLRSWWMCKSRNSDFFTFA